MDTSAKIAAEYGFGARAPWAAPRASEYDMKERARLSGLLPRVNDEPLSKTLAGLVKEFEKNAALGAILERRRALEGRSQYVLQGQEAMDNVNRNLAPWARVGRAVEANSARVAQRIAGVATPDAADVMTGGRVGGPTRTGDAYLMSTANDAALSLQREYPQTNLDGGLVAANAKAKSRRRYVGTVEKT